MQSAYFNAGRARETSTRCHHQKGKNEHILYLEKLLQDIESGRVLRLTRSIARFLGRS